MSAEIVNLKHARKQKQREDKQAKAAANRRAFGRTKTEKTADQQHRDKATQELDGKRLEGDHSDPSE